MIEWLFSVKTVEHRTIAMIDNVIQLLKKYSTIEQYIFTSQINKTYLTAVKRGVLITK